MLEDLRNHDPSPTQEEREWMTVNPFAVTVRLLALAGIAMAIGLSGTSLLQADPKPTTLAVTTE